MWEAHHLAKHIMATSSLRPDYRPLWSLIHSMRSTPSTGFWARNADRTLCKMGMHSWPRWFHGGSTVVPHEKNNTERPWTANSGRRISSGRLLLSEPSTLHNSIVPQSRGTHRSTSMQATQATHVASKLLEDLEAKTLSQEGEMVGEMRKMDTSTQQLKGNGWQRLH